MPRSEPQTRKRKARAPRAPAKSHGRSADASKPEPLILGIDIGGTKVAAGLVDSRGQIVARTRRPMVARKSAAEGLAAVVETIQVMLASDAARERSVEAIGISTPGNIDPLTGAVVRAANLPCWRDFPLAKEIARATKLEVKVDNDGNAAALAEAAWGAGVGYNSVFYLTLGTGVGTGIVIGGEVYHGRTGAAGEGGHVTIDYRGPRCTCGKQGCIEVYAAGPAIAQRAQARLIQTERAGAKLNSKMLEIAGGRINAVNAEHVGRASLEGDPLATEILQETADYLTIWIGNTIDLLEPDVIVVGGGLGQLMSSFFSYIRSRLPMWSINPRCQEIPIVGAVYGAVSGIAGAAALCLSRRILAAR